MSFHYSDSEELIEKYFHEEKWSKARLILTKELEHEPKNSWFLTRISTTYYEEKKYEKALRFAEKALKLNPNDPLVLWDYAGCLEMLGKREKAIKIWVKVISFGPKRIGIIETGEGLEWANSLIADCYYRLGVAQLAINDKEGAFENLHKHMDMRNDGVDSIYPIELVKEKVNLLN